MGRRCVGITVLLGASCLACWIAFADESSPPKSDHWAYQKPRQVALPAVVERDWCRNALDAFVLSRLEREGLAPSPNADKSRLLRRLSLDLIGLPPSVEELSAFLADESPDAYERAVDRLLGSPQFGERWAIPWLDAARYADSNGFQRDGHRSAWPFRDWVIRAINSDMPFDQFTIEQLAGDLLPDATTDQRIATGFHRGTTVNLEAGTDQEENRVNQIFDRVNVTGTVWLGTTLECCQCHDHKYDPFSQTEYYRLFAFFNNTEIETREATKGSAARDFVGPSLELPETRELIQRRQEISDKMQSLTQASEARERESDEKFVAWQVEVTTADQPPQGVTPAMLRILKTPEAKRNQKQQQQLKEFFFGRDPEWKAMRQQLSDLKKQFDNLRPASSLVMSELSQPRITRWLIRGNFETPGDVVEAGTPHEFPAWRDDLPSNRLGFARWLVSPDNPLVARVTVNRWWQELFGRGLHATPEDFGVMSDEPLHRELLDWLAVELMESGWSMKHVVRLIVTSATYQQSCKVADFGLRTADSTSSRQTGANPQSSIRNPQSVDPENQLLWRGPRHRLTAELIRDQSLAISGLLSRKMGGPPVYPPQPANIWRVTGVVDNNYPTSTGLDRYRRGVYTVWRRSSPYPSFVNFDAPDRAACVIKRAHTNTPLQALTLLNDPVYVETAIRLAERLQAETSPETPVPSPRRGEASSESADSQTKSAIGFGFQLCLARFPSEAELQTLIDLFDAEQRRFLAQPQAARGLLGTDTEDSPQDLAQRAAWVSVANALLNLDELINKG